MRLTRREIVLSRLCDRIAHLYAERVEQHQRAWLALLARMGRAKARRA